MTSTTREIPPAPEVGPPTTHQLALMIWVAVFPTLTTLNLLLGDWIADLQPVLRPSPTTPRATKARPTSGATGGATDVVHPPRRT